MYRSKTFGILLSALVLILAPLGAQTVPDLEVFQEQTENNGYKFFVNNPSPFPQYLVLDFPVLNNMAPSVSVPLRITIAGGTERQELLELTAIRQASYSFRSSYLSSLGDPSAVHDDTHAYLLPFAHGTKQRLTQGNNGRFTHMGENRFAWDFDLPIGTPIHAARAGIVVETKFDSNRGGPGAEFNSAGNFIMILHDDGSFGNYVHLQQNGVLVVPGQRVEAGEKIGLSGNTGRSSGPHLHFDVRLTGIDGKMSSIPTRFLTGEGEVRSPREGEYLYAWHPGGEPFTAVFGTDLTNEDFATYTKDLAISGKTDIRSETIDSTFIVYVQNSYNRRVRIDYTFRLTNLTASMPNPGSIEVPAGKEIFLMLLQPRPDTTSTAYNVSYRISFLD